MKENKSGTIAKIRIEKIAEETAITKGYYQSDKTQFTTTPWCEHNIFVKGFMEGYAHAKEQQPDPSPSIFSTENMD
jgi:hypothetical protein